MNKNGDVIGAGVSDSARGALDAEIEIDRLGKKPTPPKLFNEIYRVFGADEAIKWSDREY